MAAQAQAEERIRLRYVTVPQEPSWVPLLAVAHLGADEPRDEVTYAQLALRETWLSLDQFIADIANGVVRTEPPPSALTNSRWARSFFPSGNPYGECPGTLFQIPWSSMYIAHPTGALVEYGKPYHPDPSDAIRQWLHIADWHGDSDARTGHLLVWIPERRACFRRVQRRSDTTISVEIGTSIEPLTLKGGWVADRVTTPIDRAASDQTIELDVPVDATQLDLFLMDPANIYDYHREGLGSFFEHRTRVLGSNAAIRATDDLLMAIQRGEDQHIEFKKAVDLGDPKKLQEVVKSVIAFSNSSSGIIVIGVADDCEIVGISSSELHKWYGKAGHRGTATPTDPLKAYATSVRKHINETIRPSPAIQVEGREVAGKALLTITVTEGQDKPYQEITSNAVWVRHGASNRQPGQEELRALCGAGSQGTFANSPDPFR
ncbi:MAG: AlbA family DNA-binding domain-containing protein [Acidiferrobacteraceae bacterium]